VPSDHRDLRLDLFRGLALIFIFIDHIPENFLSYFTLQAVGFYDAAEVFIFISGFTAALVYGRSLEAGGPVYATAQILRRAWQLYVAHIFLFTIFIAEVSYTVTAFNNPMYNEETRVADFLGEPHIAIVKALLLEFQPTFLDILPLYIVLLLVFPPILLGLRRHPAVVVTASLLIYGAVQVTSISVPAYPEGHLWYFNPLAWQLLFTAGAAMGYAELRGRSWLPRAQGLIPLAIAILAAATVVKTSWTVHGVWESFPGVLLKELWPVNKNNLSPLRLVPFLALVLLVAAAVPRQAAWLRAAAARPLILCGQQSLEIFCLGILLSALAHFLLEETQPGLAGELGVNVAGIVAMCLIAKLIDWYKSMGRTSASVTQPELPRADRRGGAGR
jgi:hypothetical protein